MGQRMTNGSRVLPATDDSALPDEERALLERARALIPRLAERAPAASAARMLPAETMPVSCASWSPSALAACRAASACFRGSSRN